MDHDGPAAVLDTPVSGLYLKEELYRRIGSDAAIFEFIQAGSLDGIWYRDMENPECEWMSPRFKEVFGYRDDEVPNTSAWCQENIFAEDLAVVLENFEKHRANPSHAYDQIVRYRHKNGSTVWVRCRGMAIRDERGKPIRMLGAHTDVTSLKLTEERLRALHEGAPDMYLVGDLSTGLISECNQALLSNTGHESILEMSFVELCHADSVAEARAVLQALETQPEVRGVELKFARTNGSSFAVLMSANLVRQNGLPMFRAWCRDISYLKCFANIEVLLAALPGAVLLTDEAMVVSSANPATEHMFGYAKGELTGRPFGSLLSGSLVRGPAAESEGIRKDGTCFAIHVEFSSLQLGDGTFHIATMTDMAARKSAETALRDSEHRFRQLTESLPQLVWTCTPEGSCDYLSPQWVAYTGVPESAQLQRGWLTLVHPDDRDAFISEWSNSMRRGERFQFEYRIRRYDGAYRWFDGRAISLRNTENQIVKWFGASIDIHEGREMRVDLEREKARLANLVALAPAVFYSYAISSEGRIWFPYPSEAIGDLLGVSAGELKRDATILRQRYHPSDLFKLQESSRISSETMSPWHCEFRIRHPDRGERWIEGHSTPACEPDGTIVWHGFMTDITERKKVEADQQFLLELGSALQTASTPEEIGRVATRMLADHLEVDRSTLSSVDAGRGIATVIHSHSRQLNREGSKINPTFRVSKAEADLFAAGAGVRIENTATDPSTAARYAEYFKLASIEAVMAVPLLRRGFWLGTLSLICSQPRKWSQREFATARAAAERIWAAYEIARALAAERELHQDLCLQEERLRLALESSGIGTWDYDAVTGKINWDGRCKAIFGFPPDLEVTAEIVLACVHSEDLGVVKRQLRAYKRPGNRFDAEYRIYAWNDGSLKYVYGRGKMFFESQGHRRREARAIGTVQDITALKRGEEALRRANQELEQFAYAAAHDLQEPLRNVGLATQILARRYQGKFDSDADELLKAAVEGPLRMQSMVKDLLAYSRTLAPEEGAPLIADANEVLALALKNLVVATQEKDARITWETLPKVRMSDLHLLQLFQNLIGNALKYSGPRQPVIHIAAARRLGECTLSVRDNGVGIPPEYHARAFGVFKRLHSENVPGTGIGLALCKRIVEHYGGKIWIESNPDQGATVLFTPPIADEKQEPTARAGTPS